MTEDLRAELLSLGEKHFNSDRFKMEPLKGDGSDRAIYRLSSEEGSPRTVAGVIHRNLEENEDFWFIGRKLSEAGIPVPKIYSIGPSRRTYLLQYLGRLNLAESIDLWKSSGRKDKIVPAYRRVIEYLVEMQTRLYLALEDFFGERPRRKADYLQDLKFFEKNFMERFEFRELLNSETENELRSLLLEPLNAQSADCFVYRDFQSRNVMWLSDSPWFIDYQSALAGSPLYDLASLLYASRSGLDEESRGILLKFYFEISPRFSDFGFFEDMFYKLTLIRRLRSLGSYGFLSMEKGKSRFFESIHPALLELRSLLEEKPSFKGFSCLSEAIRKVSGVWRENWKDRIPIAG